MRRHPIATRTINSFFRQKLEWHAGCGKAVVPSSTFGSRATPLITRRDNQRFESTAAAAFERPRGNRRLTLFPPQDFSNRRRSHATDAPSAGDLFAHVVGGPTKLEVFLEKRLRLADPVEHGRMISATEVVADLVQAARR